MLARVPRDAAAVLDYATGTGTLALAAARRCPGARVVGVDLSASMLEVARRRAAASGLDRRAEFVRADAEAWEPPEGAFDAVLAGYLPKYVDMDRWLPRAARALKPGGVLAAYDFTYPSHPLARAGWEAWWRVLGPALRRDAAWRAVAEELPGLVRGTTWAHVMQEALPRHGFDHIARRSMGWGIAAMVTASRVRPEPAAPNPAKS